MFIIEIDPIVTSGDIKHDKTSWQVSLSPLFNDDDIVFESLDDEENLTRIKVPLPLTDEDMYYSRTKIHFSDDTDSGWGKANIITRNASGFSFNDTIVTTPELTTDFNRSSAPLGGFIVTGSDFKLFMGIGKHRATNWLIEDDKGNTIWKRLNDKHNLTSIRIPSGLLEPGKMYTIKASYVTDTNAYSNYGKLRIVTNASLTDDPVYQYQVQDTLLKQFEVNTALRAMILEDLPMQDLMEKLTIATIQLGFYQQVVDRLNEKIAELEESE